MQRTKPESSRSTSSVPYQQFQSPSLVSLPMLPRPSTGGLAPSGGLADGPRRGCVNSKAGALGSLFRTRIHAKRGSNAGSDGMSPALEPLDAAGDMSWGVGIDCPAVSPLFTDESLQQLLGASPTLNAQQPWSPLPDAVGSPGAARRSKREMAASVLHNSTGPFRRLRAAPAGKTLSFPPAIGVPMHGGSGGGGDEFVVVTPDMCPPAALVSSSVISGVSPLEASAAVAVAAASRIAVQQGLAPAAGGLPLRTRARTHVSRSTEMLLLMHGAGYEDSTDSLVRISTPSLSASSSEASLPLSQATAYSAGSLVPLRKKPPMRHQHTLQLPRSAPRVGPLAQLDALSPYTVSRLNTTAARASERRRRSSARRPRPSSVSSGTWNISAGSDATLPAGHTRTMSDGSECMTGLQFTAASPTSDGLWPHNASPPSDTDDLALHLASGFPSSCSAHFNFEVGRDTGSACESPRQRTQSSGALATPSPTAVRSAMRDVMSMLDPSSPAHDVAERSMALHMLAQPERTRVRARAHTHAYTIDDSLAADLANAPDLDGSTLTHPGDWQLMNDSGSDNERPALYLSHPRRRVRKRRVLPTSIFQSPSKARPARPAASVAGSAAADAAVNATGPAAAVTAQGMSAAAPTRQGPVGIPYVPLSIQHRLRIEHVARLTVHCTGDRGSWQPARIPCFSLLLAACIERAHGVVELALVNVGLTGIAPALLQCHGLRRLNMAHNWIATVPPWLARLRGLEHITLAGNPLRVVAAELVEMRQRLATLDLGAARNWALLARPAAPPPPLAPDERTGVLAARLRATATRRVAACIDAARLSVTQRQHAAALDRATKLLALYSNALHAALHEPRSWGHSVAMPLPAAHH
ncbi:hypothetical protein LPJ61_000881 [Coemansia biformis]|uniref:Uncharacterized protein n=1 Tax=Coemansia biformis TaxID=1286918 RepID=A0A9W8D176_9FUNG|nr:hypothetical protein LPJ61_000881 [Coemansia biformis]